MNKKRQGATHRSKQKQQQNITPRIPPDGEPIQERHRTLRNIRESRAAIRIYTQNQNERKIYT